MKLGEKGAKNRELAINILKTGYLFLAAEASNHCLYLFKSDGEDEV
jgi:hypothetical protein